MLDSSTPIRYARLLSRRILEDGALRPSASRACVRAPNRNSSGRTNRRSKRFEIARNLSLSLSAFRFGHQLFTSRDRVDNRTRGTHGESRLRQSGSSPLPPIYQLHGETHAPLVEGSYPHSHLHRSHGLARRSASGSQAGREMNNARSLIPFAVVYSRDDDEGVLLRTRGDVHARCHDATHTTASRAPTEDAAGVLVELRARPVTAAAAATSSYLSS